MKKNLVLCIPLLWVTSVYSQDSIHLKKPKFKFFAADTTPFKKHIDFQIDNRYSFIKSKPVNIYGINIGYFTSKKIRVGLGGYLINKEYYSKRANNKAPSPFDNTLHLYYLTPNLTYVYVNNRWIELSVMVETGLGIVNYYRTNEVTHKTVFQREFFVPVQLGVGTLFKLNRWIGFQGTIGYRYIVLQSKAAVFKTVFDGFYYTYGVQIVIGNIIKDLNYLRKYKKQQKLLKSHQP
jgi:hypothetical protein